MVRDVGRRGRDDRRGLRGWLIMSNQEPKKDSLKHLLITHNLQSIIQGAMRRSKDPNSHNSDLKTVPAMSIHLSTLGQLHPHAQSAENLTSTSFYAKSTLATHVASLSLCISPSSLLISVHGTQRHPQPPKKDAIINYNS